MAEDGHDDVNIAAVGIVLVGDTDADNYPALGTTRCDSGALGPPSPGDSDAVGRTLVMNASLPNNSAMQARCHSFLRIAAYSLLVGGKHALVRH